MIKKIIITSLLLSVGFVNFAQKYATKTGTIKFNASTPLEKIVGTNKSVSSVIDSKLGSVQYALLIKSFVFDNSLLQEHFNENYMESDKLPKATFKGTITNLSAIDFTKDGSYKADVAGQLFIHGVTKDVKSTGKIVIKNGKLTLQSAFTLLLADYNIAIPSAVKDKIAKTVNVTVNAELSKL
jgi:hypothetical protein